LNGSGVTDLIGTTSSTRFTWPATFGNMHPLSIIYFVPLCGDYIQMSFFLRSPKIRILVVPKLQTLKSFSNQVYYEIMRATSYNFQKDLSNDI
jgi:hypothetical protein